MFTNEYTNGAVDKSLFNAPFPGEKLAAFLFFKAKCFFFVTIAVDINQVFNLISETSGSFSNNCTFTDLMTR